MQKIKWVGKAWLTLSRKKSKYRVQQAFNKIAAILLVITFFLSSVLPVYAVTFTAGMAKRDAPGPFAGGVIPQGDPGNTDSLTDDIISYSRGSQISGNFYQGVDSNQGSLVLWWTPEYGSSDLSVGGHYIVDLAGSSDLLLFYDYINDRFRYGDIGGTIGNLTYSITAGTTYLIINSFYNFQ